MTQEAYKRLTEIVSSREPIMVITGNGVHPNMALSRMKYTACWIEDDDPGDEDPSHRPNRIACVEIDMTYTAAVHALHVEGSVDV